MAGVKEPLLPSGEIVVEEKGHQLASGRDSPPRTSGTGVLQTAAAITKMVVGAGSFFLPGGVKQAGYMSGIIGIPLMGILCAYLSVVVLNAKQRLFGNKHAQLTDMAEVLFGRPGYAAAAITIFLSSCGAVAVYLVFCSDIMSSLVCHLVAAPAPGMTPGGKCEPTLSAWQWMLIMTCLETLLSFSPSFKYLAVTSFVGDFCLLFALAITFYYGAAFGFINPDNPAPPGEYVAFDVYGLPLFFGPAAFLFAIPSLLFPAHNALKDHRTWWQGSTLAFVLVTVLNAVFAVYAYFAFGKATNGQVLNNITGSQWFVPAVHVALVFDLFFTFPLVLTPCRDVAEQYLLGDAQDTSIAYWKRIAIRVAIHVFCFGLAVGIPDVSDLVGLTSGLSVAFMCFVLGPAVVLKVEHLERKRLASSQLLATNTGHFASLGRLSAREKWRIAGYVAIMLFGVLAAVTTTYLAVVQVIDDIKKGKFHY